MNKLLFIPEDFETAKNHIKKTDFFADIDEAVKVLFFSEEDSVDELEILLQKEFDGAGIDGHFELQE